MNNKQINILIGVFIFIFFMILIILLREDNCCACGASNGCCPCPNREYINEVETWIGYDASGAGSWKYMCDEYKKATNKTFDCFKVKNE